MSTITYKTIGTNQIYNTKANKELNIKINKNVNTDNR